MSFLNLHTEYSVRSLLLLPIVLFIPHFAKCSPAHQIKPLSLPGALGVIRPSCASFEQYPSWYHASQKFDIGNCDKAIKLFYNDYVKDHNGARYEYLTSGMPAVHGIPTQRVPLKVAVETCTIVIAMRSQFQAGQLPNETPFKSAASDVSSFQKLYQGILEVGKVCADKESQPGWYETGDLNSIGVFIWQSASEINQELRQTSRFHDDTYSDSVSQANLTSSFS